MTDLRGGGDFAFADVVRISPYFEYTGEVNSRQNRPSISLFRSSAKWDSTPFWGGCVTAMMTPSYHGYSREEHRLQAVLALFRGEKTSQVSAEFRISRSDLYKFRQRALAAMCEALKDHPRGPKRPYNRISEEKEQKVIA